ncbi:PucR family transcriptional regulator ligand-binding domain-containing protein [Microbacterium sp. KR10-403]|uniref:PucR family transcriptional regulator n=1 Tax=Microbacterium sp. KR10-403 TaxID=3158581 RepID=UPI0032E4EA24
MTTPQSVLTVDDIVSTKSLDVTVLAGSSGLDRPVLWAHSCELIDPEQWLGPQELLMTVGLCVPGDASAQVDFIRRLDTAALAGLMVGDHEALPALSDEMLREADRRGFPVLLAATHTPYAAVARHVAAANTSSQLQQVLTLSKLYHLAAEVDDDAQALMDGLVKILGAGISVEDRTTGLIVLSADHPARAETRPEPRRYVLRGADTADLVLSEYPGEELDALLLVHLIKILEVTVDRILAAARRRAERGARALASLLDGTRPAALDELLAPHTASEGFQVAAFASADADRVARAVALRGLPVLVGPGRTSSLALLPVEATPQVRAVAEPGGVRFGVSSVFTSYGDVRAAADEAARVLSASRQSDRAWTEFAGTTISVLTRSNREAADIITGVLGPLADERPSAEKLRETLFAYLRHDRHWQETADELGIHRQTLSYRLNRIEEETDMSVTRSSDLSAFWIAYQAWETTRAGASPGVG